MNTGTSRVVLYMSMSLDGFIAGPEDTKDNALGNGGHRLHKWLAEGGGDDPADYRPSDQAGQTVFDEMMATGAVITGSRTADFADYWDGDHHDGVPIFVLTHQAPTDTHAGIRFVTDGIGSCAEQAKSAAGDRDVMLHGADTAQQFLRSGMLDVLEISLVPVLFGDGRRLFDQLAHHVELVPVRTLESPNALHLRYEVKHA